MITHLFVVTQDNYPYLCQWNCLRYRIAGGPGVQLTPPEPGETKCFSYVCLGFKALGLRGLPVFLKPPCPEHLPIHSGSILRFTVV